MNEVNIDKPLTRESINSILKSQEMITDYERQNGIDPNRLLLRTKYVGKPSDGSSDVGTGSCWGGTHQCVNHEKNNES